MPDFRGISSIPQLKAILLTQSLLSTFKHKFLKRQSSFRRHLNNPQEIEDLLLQKGDFLSKLLHGIVTNLRNNISKLIVELLFLPEK